MNQAKSLAVVKKKDTHSLTISGHRTSLSLEPEFWLTLKQAAAIEKRSLTSLVTEIDSTRQGCNLSSAIRVWILVYVKAAKS